jgi:hypothetical protein
MKCPEAFIFHRNEIRSQADPSERSDIFGQFQRGLVFSRLLAMERVPLEVVSYDDSWFTNAHDLISFDPVHDGRGTFTHLGVRMEGKFKFINIHTVYTIYV